MIYGRFNRPRKIGLTVILLLVLSGYAMLASGAVAPGEDSSTRPSDDSSPLVGVATILEATEHCTTREEFSEFLAGFGFCYDESVREETFTYSTHFVCGTTELGSLGLRVNFAISDDGGLNSSLTTRNQAYAEHYQRELREFAFTATETDAIREGAQWYSSARYPEVSLMWEELETQEAQKLWHIGFVWRPTADEGSSEDAVE